MLNSHRLILATVYISTLSTLVTPKHYEDAKSDHHKSRLPMNITAVADVSVDLRCKARLHECGNFFNIQWYKEQSGRPSERVYIYNHRNGQSNAGNSWQGRAQHVYNSKTHVMSVALAPTRLTDEAFYRCEVTYDDGNGRWFKRSCLSSQVTKLTVLERPETVEIELENGTLLHQGQMIGPLNEGSILIMRCKAGNGKPMPQISWWNGTDPLSNSWHRTIDHTNGTGSAVSVVNIVLGRGNLRRRITCRVNNSALDSPIRRSVVIDMNLSPQTLEMLPVPVRSSPVAEGGNITLTCIARGAKPAAHIYWNSEPELNLNDTREEISREGFTFKTTNRLTFRAERRLTSISCFASNKVMDSKKEMHLRRDTTINVKYKPFIEKKASLDRVRVVQGEDTLVYCNYDANPSTATVIRWYHNHKPISMGRRYQRGSKDASLLRILDADKGIEGLYSCSAENEVGISALVDQTFIKVEEKPKVRLWVEPAEAVNELLNANVTLVCLSEKGERFLAVKWYLDGEMLQHVALAPECINDTLRIDSQDGKDFVEQETNCNMDTTKIILVNVSRTFHGNYSCRGKNMAGWGPMSEVKQLKVLYPPQGAILTQNPSIIKKGRPFRLECTAKKPGFPEVDSAVWFQHGRRIRKEDLVGKSIRMMRNMLLFEKAEVSSTGNYSCIPANKAGASLMHQPEEKSGDAKKLSSMSESTSMPIGAMASANVLVYSPPTLLRRPKSETGAPRSQRELNLVCEVECDPVCSLNWLKNGVPLRRENSTQSSELRQASVRTAFFPPNVHNNVQMRVESTLTLHLERLPKMANYSEYQANYTCISSANRIGLGVEATTFFRIHYPPRYIEVTPRSQILYEGSRATSLTCRADSFPAPRFHWKLVRKIASTNEESSRFDLNNNENTNNLTFDGPIIDFLHPIKRQKAGVYKCTAFNDLGNISSTASITVNFQPKCRLQKYDKSKGESSDKYRKKEFIVLSCDVIEAEPNTNLTYAWFHEEKRMVGASHRTLHLTKGAIGFYACQVSNVVGKGDECSIKVGDPAAALVSEEKYTMYLAFGLLGMLLMFGTILSAIFICRRGSLISNKYDFHSFQKEYKTKGGTDPNPGTEAVTADKRNGSNGVCLLTTSAAPNNVVLPSNGAGAVVPPPPYARLKGGNNSVRTLKRVRMADDLPKNTSSIEYDENCSEQDEFLFESVEVTPEPECFMGRRRRRMLMNDNLTGRTCEVSYGRAPRELWLV